MSQFICLQVGQCGNQIGSVFWPLTLHEYGIKTYYPEIDGLKIHRDYKKSIDDITDAFYSFFHVPETTKSLSFRTVSDLAAAKVKMRAVLIDMEDSVVSRFKEGHLKSLFDQTCFVTNYPGSANNWAEGHLTHGKVYHAKIAEAVRKTVERCDSLSGFLLMHSLGGGTGSGLGTAVLNLLKDEYPLGERFVTSVYPAKNSDVITAPYNVLLASSELVQNATCVFPADNSALLDICQWQVAKSQNLEQAKYNAVSRPFQDMNSIIANMLLHVTSGARFPGDLNTDMNDLATNLVPYPQLHYIFSSISPITLTTPPAIVKNHKLEDEHFTNCWSKLHQLISFNPLEPGSVVTAAGHIARGNFSLETIRNNIERFQKKAKFTPWSKEAMKVGMCSVPPAGHSTSLLCLLNSTSMRFMFKNVVDNADKLLKRRAHIHHYLNVDEFEMDNFSEARETILTVYEIYKEIERQKPLNVPRLQVL